MCLALEEDIHKHYISLLFVLLMDGWWIGCNATKEWQCLERKKKGDFESFGFLKIK